MKIEFSLQIFEKRQTSNFMNIRLVGAELFLRTDGQTNRRTDMTKLIVAFHNFAKVPNN